MMNFKDFIVGMFDVTEKHFEETKTGFETGDNYAAFAEYTTWLDAWQYSCKLRF